MNTMNRWMILIHRRQGCKPTIQRTKDKNETMPLFFLLNEQVICSEIEVLVNVIKILLLDLLNLLRFSLVLAVCYIRFLTLKSVFSL